MKQFLLSGTRAWYKMDLCLTWTYEGRDKYGSEAVLKIFTQLWWEWEWVFSFSEATFFFQTAFRAAKARWYKYGSALMGKPSRRKFLLRESGGLGNLPYEHFVSHSFSPSLSLTHPHTRIYYKEDISLSLFLHTNSHPCTVHRTHTLLCTRTIGIQHPITHSHKKNTLSTFHLSLSLSLHHPFARSLSLSETHTHALSHILSLFPVDILKDLSPKLIRNVWGNHLESNPSFHQSHPESEDVKKITNITKLTFTVTTSKQLQL